MPLAARCAAIAVAVAWLCIPPARAYPGLDPQAAIGAAGENLNPAVAAPKPGSAGESTTIRLAALGRSDLPHLPLSEEEAHQALERDLLLKVGKQLQLSDYPDEARRWRWSGTALVEVVVAADGIVKQVALSRSSGFRVLDMQALEVVRRVPKLFVPIGSRQRDRTVTVPVGFYLQRLSAR